MTETREIRLDVTEKEKALLCEILDWAAEKVAKKQNLEALKAKINLAWVEAEFRDEDEAHIDWVRRECDREVEPDPDVVVRHVDGRDTVVSR